MPLISPLLIPARSSMTGQPQLCCMFLLLFFLLFQALSPPELLHQLSEFAPRNASGSRVYHPMMVVNDILPYRPLLLYPIKPAAQNYSSQGSDHHKGTRYPIEHPARFWNVAGLKFTGLVPHI